MYEFRTKYCEDFPNFMCKKAKPYVCTRAHYENNIRRRPRLVQGKFNFTDKLCTHASLADCPKGMNCSFSHRVQKEHIYHPSVYKTQVCESPLCEDGVCAEFGVHCAKAHGMKDLRQPQYEAGDPRAQIQQTSGNSSPNSSSSLSSQDSKLRADAPCFQMPKTVDESTKEVKSHSDYMYRFRVETCGLHSKGKCPVDASTCFYHHSGKNIGRRVPKLINGKFNYLPIRCRDMLKTKACHQGEQCRFAHSKEEVIYHPSKYKTQLCPHPLRKVSVIKQPGNVISMASETSSRACKDGKAYDMLVCAGYGIHCARAHGQSDLRHPVFENCSKKAPAARPLYPNTPCRDVSSSIFTRTGMTHSSRQPDPVYRSMHINDSVFTAGQKSERTTPWMNASSFGAERSLQPRWISASSSMPSVLHETKDDVAWSDHRANILCSDLDRCKNTLGYGLVSIPQGTRGELKQQPAAPQDSLRGDFQNTNSVSNTRLDNSKGLAKYLPSFLVNFVTND